MRVSRKSASTKGSARTRAMRGERVDTCGRGSGAVAAPDARVRGAPVGGDRLERILASYEEMDRRFAAAGGLGSLLNLYEQVRRELERVSFEELDRMTLEIKTVIEALLKMDYELRKVHNLKLAFEARSPGAGALG